MLPRIICLAVGYACGLFQTSYIYGKKNGIDIREHGSGNAGTTNALRTLGKKAGALTLLGDCLKCVVAVVIARLLFGTHQGTDLLALGGKGVAASAGLLLAFDIRIFPICAVLFFGTFFLTHYVSLSSLLAYLGFFVSVLIFGQTGMLDCTQPVLFEVYVLSAALTALAYWRHRQNIVRLIHGNENKIFLGKQR